MKRIIHFSVLKKLHLPAAVPLIVKKFLEQYFAFPEKNLKKGGFLQ